MGVSYNKGIINSTPYFFDANFRYGRLVSIYDCFLILIARQLDWPIQRQLAWPDFGTILTYEH